MAINKLQDPSTLTIKFDHGLNEKGRSVIRAKTYTGVKYDANDEALFEIAEAIASLQEHNLHDVVRHDHAILAE